MATTFKWVAGETPATALSTELNGLSNDTMSSLGSTEIDNTVGLYRWIDLELYLSSITTGSGSPYCAVWFVYSHDGTNYEDAPNNTLGDKPPDAIFNLIPSVTQAQKKVVANIPIPPLKFKMILFNASGSALAASGNTVKYSRHYEQSV